MKIKTPKVLQTVAKTYLNVRNVDTFSTTFVELKIYASGSTGKHSTLHIEYYILIFNALNI